MLPTEVIFRSEVNKLKLNKEKVSIEDQQGKYKNAFAKQRKAIADAFKNLAREFFGDLTAIYDISKQEALQKSLQQIMDAHKPAVTKAALIECDADAVMFELRGIAGEFTIAKANIERFEERSNV